VFLLARAATDLRTQRFRWMTRQILRIWNLTLSRCTHIGRNSAELVRMGNKTSSSRGLEKEQLLESRPSRWRSKAATNLSIPKVTSSSMLRVSFLSRSCSPHLQRFLQICVETDRDRLSWKHLERYSPSNCQISRYVVSRNLGLASPHRKA